MPELRIIGISGEGLDARQRDLLADCRAVAASGRQARLLEGFAARLLPVTPLARLIEELRQDLRQGNCAVLASGDPLFYGVGRTLLAAFGRERLVFFPAVSAMQLACARFGMPWDDLDVHSLHGREENDIAGQILCHQRLLLLTDRQNSPDAIARLLRERLEAMHDSGRLQSLRLRVAENLGLAGERLTEGTIDQIEAGTFSPLNVVLVEQQSGPLPGFGLRQEEIIHNRGLITKDEVRAVILHRLRLPPAGVFWDIGGGAGSISLEASALVPELVIFCIEKTVEGQEAIRRNIVASGRYRINLICGEAPRALDDLPAPDRVFIGGSGGNLATIIAESARHLRPGGILAASAVREETARLAPRCFAEAGLRVSQARVGVERLADDTTTWHQHNTITIITGQR